MSKVNSEPPNQLTNRQSHVSAPGDLDNLKMFEKENELSSLQLEKDLKVEKKARYIKWSWMMLLFLLTTTYYVASMAITPEDPLIRSILYFCIVFKLLFEVIPTKLITDPLKYIFLPIDQKINSIPRLYTRIVGVSLTLITLLSLTFAAPNTDKGTTSQRCQSLLGLVVFLTIMVFTSNDRRRINWQPVITGILLQVLLGVLVIKTDVGMNFFLWISQQCNNLLAFAEKGSDFLFRDLSKTLAFTFIVLPGILFFASFIQVLYYLGAMQWLIVKFAWFFKYVMGTSGCESVVAAASPFVGMGESALLVKPFLAEMTQSELHQVMSSGFATIAGSVLLGFLKMGIDPLSLITSCVMSIPCSLALSKLRYPEVEESKSSGTIEIPEYEERESNILHAAANGAAQGVTLCLLIAGTLLAIISLVALVDGVILWLSSYLKQTWTLSFILGFPFRLFAWLIGIPWDQVKLVGELMATKLVTNEFDAFAKLAEQGPKVLSVRAQILTVYSLCGFANFTSIGIQVGCLGAMAPTRKADLARLAFSAMVTGTMCTFVSATIAGILI